VIAGDSGAWPDPAADAIFSQLLRQAAELSPVFLANLGDFAGPGTVERHEHYLALVAPLTIPNVCLVGNHDLEDPASPEAWAAVHGPRNFHFAYGHTRFVEITLEESGAASGRVFQAFAPPGTAPPFTFSD
jgi:Calcineurin-like phosphoesterase